MTFEEHNYGVISGSDKELTPKKWRVMTVKEISSEMSDAPFGSKLKSKDYTDKGVPVVQGRNIQNNRFEWNNKLFVSYEKKEELKKHLCKTGDLVFPKVGTIGGCAILPNIDGKNEFLLSTNMMKINVDEKKQCLNYIYYYFSNPIIQKTIQQFSASSVQPVFNFTSLKKFPIVVPSLEEQKAIASILNSLDNKIELNNVINKNLEEMAQAIFKRWFVDFEFPNEKGEPYKSSGGEFEESELGLVPKGWKLTQLEEVLEINPKRVLKKGERSPYVEMKSIQNNYARVSEYVMREYSSGSKFSNGDVLLARITPCLENGKTAYVDFLNDNEVGWGSTEFIVLRSRSGISSEFPYFLARSDQFRSHAILSMTGSSGRQRVPESSLKNYRIPLPVTQDLFSAFGGIAKSVLELMKKNDDESYRLIHIRDSLLPKLMSGEIRVPLEQS
ncbi:hypothetical protein B5G50_25035 [Brevibacillus brevis]|uniref:restriction endonuclease subunit S n=1 Tax=Brevibacillus brevis TaxID=1393 RepID=UPI000B3A300C|nr:restriction endonuclease subunit S [Brevibacillus brevis]OUQ85785.1 hypothetical protein B5G50_25035 [Brevibacillus brevis]